jgi:hypothetical protein
MAALMIGALQVKVAPGTFNMRPVEIGDRERSLNGTLRSSVRATKREYSAATPPIPLADANTLRAALQTIPQTCSGDLLGETISCHGRLTSWDVAAIPGATFVTVGFELLEV